MITTICISTVVEMETIKRCRRTKWQIHNQQRKKERERVEQDTFTILHLKLLGDLLFDSGTRIHVSFILKRFRGCGDGKVM